jgi:5-methylcytosine-specific restriction protein A
VVEPIRSVALVRADRTASATPAEGDAMTTIRTAPTRIAATDTRKVKPPPKRAAPIYNTREYREWRRLVVTRAHGRCQDPNCATSTRRTRLFADHIVELRDGGEPFDPANGLAVCGSCHSRKTADRRAKRMGLR